MKKLASILSLLLISFCALAQINADSTIIIQGKVTDAETGNPLIGANVYLNGTYLGTATDNAGHFAMKAIKTSSPLMVSFVGYESKKIDDYAGKELVITLKHKVTRLTEVVVTVDEWSREKKMRIFLREFIGATSKDCVITNPDDIWLHHNNVTDVLTAGSDKPLLIVNKALGYKITYFIDTFRYVETIMQGKTTKYRGSYFFAEDTAGLKRGEIKKILTARDDAYYGSRMHFIRALWDDKLTKNDYKVFGITASAARLNTYDEKKAHYLYGKDLVGIKDDNHFHQQKYFTLPSNVAVLYQPAKHKMRDSYLNMDPGYLGVLIDANGFCGEGVGWNGGMGTDRVGMLLPFEFQPVGK